MKDKSLKEIESYIYVIRGQRVMIDSDLAELYEVETGSLNRQVSRNKIRFPEDFMFRLTPEEAVLLRCQNGISNKGRGGRRYQPFAFTEPGVAMLSSVLTSERAALVNISIMRTFIKLRSFLAMGNADGEKIRSLEKNTNQLFKVVFERLDSLEDSIPYQEPDRKRIGF